MSASMKAVCRGCNSHYNDPHDACGHPMCECFCMDPKPGEPTTVTVDFMEAEVR